MPAAKDITTQRQFLVTLKVAGSGGFAIPGGWDMLSGSGLSTSSSETWPSGETVPVRLQGPSMPKTITVSRSYAPSRDDEMIKQLRSRQTSVRITVVRTPLDGNGEPYGQPTTYIDCLVSEINDPAFDTSSGEAARVELVLQPSAMK